MAYRLKADESVVDGVKRVVVEEIDKAGAMLRQEGVDQATGIHEARKSFKKIRAVLRLVRPVLGSAYARENARFRDAGRELSELRDAEVLLQSFDQLRETFADQMKSEAFAEIRAALEQRRMRLGAGDNRLASNVNHVRTILEEVRHQVASWPLDRTGFAAIAPGLRNTYRQGRRARAAAYRSLSGEAFHDWRKRVKDHWYHIRLLQDVWPKGMKSYCGSLKDLAAILGDEHDLVVMKETVADLNGGSDDTNAYGAYLALVDQRQRQLRDAARPLGEWIYAEKPKCLNARLGSYWRTWRGEA